MVLDVRQALQDGYQIVRGAMALDDVLQRVVELYLVVKVIHLSLLDVVAVEAWVVHLRQKESIGICLFDVGVEVGPELHGDHFGHVKSEAIHSLVQPELGDVLEFFPGVGDLFPLPKCVMGVPIQGRCIGGQFGKLLFALWADSVVYFDGLVPIVEVGLCLSGAIARPLGGVLLKLAIC